MPNRTSVEHKAAIFANCLDNHDGILVMSVDTRPVLVRVYLTDQGHYLMPIDDDGHDNAHEQDYLRRKLRTHEESHAYSHRA